MPGQGALENETALANQTNQTRAPRKARPPLPTRRACLRSRPPARPSRWRPRRLRASLAGGHCLPGEAGHRASPDVASAGAARGRGGLEGRRWQTERENKAGAGHKAARMLRRAAGAVLRALKIGDAQHAVARSTGNTYYAKRVLDPHHGPRCGSTGRGEREGMTPHAENFRCCQCSGRRRRLPRAELKTRWAAYARPNRGIFFFFYYSRRVESAAA